MGTNSGYDLIIETANSERLRVTDDGKIGIGINAPEAKLHVLGDFTLHGTMRYSNWSDFSAEPMRIMYLDPSGELRVLESPELMAEIYRFDCKVLEGQPYPSPTWMSMGGLDYGILCTGQSCPSRVGIGTDSPITSLDVAGAIHGSRVFIGPNDAIDNDFRLRVGMTESQVFNPFLELRNNSEFRLSFTDGAISPFTLFNSQADKHYLRINNHGGTEINFFGTLDGQVVWSARDGNNQDTNASDIAVLTSDGTWWCQGVQVKTVPFWPDYVFNNNYGLKPLSQVEQYIKANHHLPEMPTAEEMLIKGMDMVEIIRILTQKIEELTLYAIDQQKEIEELKLLFGKVSMGNGK